MEFLNYLLVLALIGTLLFLQHQRWGKKSRRPRNKRAEVDYRFQAIYSRRLVYYFVPAKDGRYIQAHDPNAYTRFKDEHWKDILLTADDVKSRLAFRDPEALAQFQEHLKNRR